MNIYARIDNGVVAELFKTDGDIAEMFNAAIIWIDVTAIAPAVLVGWLYDDEQFSAPPSSTVTLDQLQFELCASVDAAADAVYAAIGGSSPGRLAEYRQANDDASAFRAAGYSGIVPATIQCWATATGWTAQEAADDILQTAAVWIGALEAIRSARLIGKASINAATTSATAMAACDAAVFAVRSATPGA